MLKALCLAILLASSAVADASTRRDPAQRAEFRRSHPCPSNGSTRGRCPGYQVDHRQPLAAGGADRPYNMQWLSKEQHKAKTRSERQSCTYGCGTR